MLKPSKSLTAICEKDRGGRCKSLCNKTIGASERGAASFSEMLLLHGRFTARTARRLRPAGYDQLSLVDIRSTHRIP